MVIQAELIRKQTEFPAKTCRVDKVVMLPPAEYAEFISEPMEYYDFIKEFNNENHAAENGMLSCLLVLGELEKDGILIDPQGYDYARYTAYIPNARQMAMLDCYPSLARAVEELAQLTDSYVREAIDGQLDGQYRIAFDDVRESGNRDLFQEELFMDMLADRAEFQWIDTDGNEIIIGIAPEYIRMENDDTLRKLTQDDVDIMCAKHTLWLHEAGGEQADFSNCLLDGIDLSHREMVNAVFHGTKFANVNLNGTDISYCEFHSAKFRGCSCSEVTAKSSEFQDAEFIGTALSRSVFEESNLSRARFINSQLDGSHMQNCCIDGTDFGGVKQCPVFSDCTSDEEAWTAEQTGQNLEL